MSPLVKAVAMKGNKELLEAFTHESAVLLASSNTAIKQWQKEPSNDMHPKQLQRYLSTIKNGAYLSSTFPIADLTRHTESLVSLVNDNKFETNTLFFNLLQRCQLRLADMQDQLKRRSSIKLAKDLIAEINHFLVQQDPELDTKEITPNSNIAIDSKTLSTTIKASIGGELVQVKADLFNLSTNFSHDVNISSALIAEQNMTIRHQIHEMNSTFEHLQNQIKKLAHFSGMQQISHDLTDSATRLGHMTHSIRNLANESEALIRQQSKLSDNLHHDLMNTRLSPFSQLIPRLKRFVRQINAELNKRSELIVYGADLKLDSTALNSMAAPLEQILRTAISYGIENYKERKQSGKNDVAQLSLTITHHESEILINLSDDGQGIDIENIRHKALAHNLINPEKMPSDEELLQLILHSNLMSADSTSDMASQGVGLNVTNSEIKALKGSLSVRTVKNKGTDFNIHLPITLSVMKALLVACGNEQYAIPLSPVLAVKRLTVEESKTIMAQGNGASYTHEGVAFQFMPLAHLLNQPFRLHDDPSTQMPLFLFKSGEVQLAILVDSINTSREIFLQPICDQLGNITALNDAAILENGQVIFVLDIPALFNNIDNTLNANNLLVTASSPTHSQQSVAMIMIDSITMRKATSNLLKRHNFEVISIDDGANAFTLLNEKAPDVLLLDSEMPKMDSFEFSTLVRNDKRFIHLPIIMFSALSASQQHEQTKVIGVSALLAKSYQEGELIEALQNLMGNRYPSSE
jgi:chemosensory pili system protein ChpA (sensor histidine kinase/response regulator)